MSGEEANVYDIIWPEFSLNIFGFDARSRGEKIFPTKVTERRERERWRKRGRERRRVSEKARDLKQQ